MVFQILADNVLNTSELVTIRKKDWQSWYNLQDWILFELKENKNCIPNAK